MATTNGGVRMKMTIGAVAAVMMAILTNAVPAAAQDYPNGPGRIVVPYPACLLHTSDAAADHP